MLRARVGRQRTKGSAVNAETTTLYFGLKEPKQAR